MSDFLCQECHGVRKISLKDNFCALCEKVLCFDSFCKGCPNRLRPWFSNTTICNTCWVVERNK